MTIKNQTAYTYDCIIEFNYSFRKKRRLNNILSIVAASLLLFLLSMQGLLLLLGEEMALQPSTVILSVVLIALFAVNLILPPIMIRRTARKQAANESVTDYTFTEEGFEQSTVSKILKEQQQCSYDILVSVTESEHYFYFFISPAVAHIVDKRGFTEGNEQDLRTLLHTVIDPKKLHIQ